MSFEAETRSAVGRHLSSPGPVEEELSQAKARLGVCVFALLYVGGWTLWSGPVGVEIVWALLGYTAFSAAWMVLVRARPGEVSWRRWVVIVGDLGINTFFMHVLQAKGAFFYPMYLWIVVGNGMRFGPRYLLGAMLVAVAYFGPMLWWSAYWRANAVAGSGLLAGLVVLPMFYLTLIKHLHAANARLTEEVERSQAAVHAKTQFLANMSHELRTPMSGVIGVSELLSKTSLSGLQQEYVGLVRRSANALLGVIDDVLELSRIEAGKVTLVSEPFDLRSIVDDVYNLLRPGADAKGLTMRLQFSEDAPRTFIGDATRVRQILVNLLGNAVKFTESGSVTLDYRYRATSDATAPLRLRVTDTGIGIAPGKLEYVFEEFEQVDNGPGSVGGSGLGLAISLRLARMMGGDIGVVSELGKGATFTVALALEPVDDSSILGKATSDRPGRNYALNALVVEDNPVNRLVTCGYLHRLGISTATAEDGESALDRVRSEVFDLVFMDIQLPILNGLETTRRIRAEEPTGRRLPIVALTANAFDEDRAECFEVGMDEHLRKPLGLVDLETAIESLMHRGLIGNSELEGR